MNTQRMLVLGVAFIASLVVALIARSLLGGGTEKVKAEVAPPHPATSEVLVASSDLQPGAALTQDSVHWQEWPKSAVDASFITQDTVSDLKSVIRGTVVRAPLVSGEPITAAKIVHADSAGFMAALVGKGMRAVSIGISTESGAGGFILPNDRVDVIVTRQVSEVPKRIASRALLSSIRVLAVDQTYREDKDQKVVLAKTATLELSPQQALQVEKAQAMGTLSLSLRALGDEGTDQATPAASAAVQTGSPEGVTVIGYGVAHTDGEQGD